MTRLRTLWLLALMFTTRWRSPAITTAVWLSDGDTTAVSLSDGDTTVVFLSDGDTTAVSLSDGYTTAVSLSDGYTTAVSLSDVSSHQHAGTCVQDTTGDRQRRSASSPAGHNNKSASLTTDVTSLVVHNESTSLITKTIHRTHVNFWPLRDTGRWSDLASLRRLLVTVVQQEMRECDLLVAYDEGYSELPLLLLLLLPNTRQVLKVTKVEDLLLRVVWVSSRCTGYLFLLRRPDHLLTFLNIHLNSWDYHGRYVMVGMTEDQLEQVTVSRKGRKTQHLLGVVQSGVQDQWTVYMNQLYWGPGVKRVATWRGHGFTSQVELFPDKVSDLQGVVLKVCTFVWEPNVFYYRSKNGSVLFRYGIDIEITKLLARTFNFSREFVEPPPGEMWGEAQADGYFSGLIGRVKRDEVDMGVADLYLVISRHPIVDMTAPYASEMKCFLVVEEPPLPRWQSLVFPLHPWTWLACLLGLLLSGPLLWIFAVTSDRWGEEVDMLQHLTSSWYYAFGLHFRQAQASVPRSASTQVVVTALWLYTITLTIVYCTNLTAFLLVRKQPRPMDTIKDLYHSGLELAVLGVFFRSGMAASSDPYIRGLSKVYVAYDNMEDILPKFVSGKAVYLGNNRFIKFMIITKFTRAGHRVRVMKECFSTFYNGMALQHHSPLTRKFDQVIGWITQSGLLHHYLSESIRLAASTEEYGGGGAGSSNSDSGGREASDGGAGTALSLDHLQGSFFIIILGWLSSTLVYSLEIIRHRRKSDHVHPEELTGP